MKDAMLQVARAISMEMTGLILGLCSLGVSFLGGCVIGAIAGFQAAQAVKPGGGGAPPVAMAPNDPAILAFAGLVGLLALISLFISLSAKLASRNVPEELGIDRSRMSGAAAIVALAIPFSAFGTFTALMPGMFPMATGMVTSAVSQFAQILAAVLFIGFLETIAQHTSKPSTRRLIKPTFIMGTVTLALQSLGNLVMIVGIAAGGIPNAPGQAPAGPAAGFGAETMMVAAGGCLSMIGMILGLVGVVFYMIVLTNVRRDARRMAASPYDGGDPRPHDGWYDERRDEPDELR